MRIFIKKTISQAIMFAMIMISFVPTASYAGNLLSKEEQSVLYIYKQLLKLEFSEKEALATTANIIVNKGLAGNSKKDAILRKSIINSPTFSSSYYFASTIPFMMPFQDRCIGMSKICNSQDDLILYEVMRISLLLHFKPAVDSELDNLVTQHNKIANDQLLKHALDQFHKKGKAKCFVDFIKTLRSSKQDLINFKEEAYNFFDKGYTDLFNKSLAYTIIQDADDLYRHAVITCQNFVLNIAREKAYHINPIDSMVNKAKNRESNEKKK